MSTGMPRPLSVDGDALAVLVERDLDGGGVAVDDLVDRVVDDLPQQVVVARAVGAADVHGRALAHRLEALEDLDVRACVRVLLSPWRSSASPSSASGSGMKVTGRDAPPSPRPCATSRGPCRRGPSPRTSAGCRASLLALLRLELDGTLSFWPGGTARNPTTRSVSSTLMTVTPLPGPCELVHLVRPCRPGRCVFAVSTATRSFSPTRLHADDLVALARLGVAAAGAGGDLGVAPRARSAGRRPSLGDREQRLRAWPARASSDSAPTMRSPSSNLNSFCTGSP